MFSNLNKPTFGAPTPGASFGLGASTSTAPGPWGNTGNTQLFGKPPTSGFGQQPSTSFGQPPTSSNSMFPFFPQTNTTAFGSTPTNQTAFGSNIFGQQQQQPAASTLFGTNTFGQQKPTSFGFGSQTPSQSNLFGQPAQPQSSIFQPAGSSTLFGSSNAFGASTVGTGTTVKFNPVTGTDTMQKSGVTTSINTKHHCITCMKEYEGKSLEELRLEDYQANRKGPQSQFGATPFGSGSSMFGQTTENKSAFGQPTGFGQIGSTTFGQPTQGFGLSTTSSSNLFAKPPAFGTTGTSSNGFGGFNTSSSVTNTFGTTQNKPFGTSTATPLFGTTQPQQQTTSFGQNMFGPNNQNTTGSFFNKPAQTTGFGTGGFGFNQTPATTTSNLFQQSKPAFGLGQPSSTNTFGQTPAFGQNNQQSTFAGSTFGKPLTFGQAQNTFQLGQTSLFTNTQQKPGSLLGGTGGGLFGTNTFGTNTTSNFGLSQPTMQPQAQGFSLEAIQESKSLTLLANNQFGHSPFLTGLLPLEKPSSPTQYTTNPMEIKKMLESNKKVEETPSFTKLNLKLGPPKTQRSFSQDNLFDENIDEEFNKFYRTSCKRLILKKRHNDSKQSIFESNSICNDLSIRSSEPSLVSVPSEMSIGSEIITPRSSDTAVSFTPEKGISETLFNGNFAKQNLNKLISENCLASLKDNALENTIGRIDISQGMEELAKQTNSEVSITSVTDSESTIIVDPVITCIFPETIDSGSGDFVEETTKETGPSGIILNRSEYYTLPPIKELDQLVSEDGRCIVKGFTVGRRGYGNVHFPDDIDVKNLNLDEIVHFRYKEIHMYPDETKKPPVGEGLNRSAQVTLDRVYPRVKETKEIIDNVEQVLAAKFPEQLIEISAKHGLKFVDYRPETGSWVFMVEHFSKYAFTESDEEDCEFSISKPKDNSVVDKAILQNGLLKKQSNEMFTKMILEGEENDLVDRTRSYEKAALRTATMKRVSEESFISSIIEAEEDNSIRRNKSDLMMDNMDTDLASEYTDEGDQRQGDILHKSMTIDLEGNEDYINPIYEPSDQDLYYHNSHIQMMKATFFSDSECPSTVSSMDIGGIPYRSQLFDVKPKTFYRKPQRPKVFKIYVNIASRSNEDILLKASQCYSDLGVFKGKSFKVGWCKGFRNYAVKIPGYSDSDHTLSLSLRTVTTAHPSETLKDAITECLKLALECSDFIQTGRENIPTFKILRDRTYLMACHKIFKKAESESQGKAEYLYNDVWSLCNALWGPGRRSIPFVKSRLSGWLKTSVQNNVPTVKVSHNQTIEEKLDIIYQHLTCFNVEKAAEIAMQSDMPALSMIISQINLTQKVKAQMQHQLENWFNNMYAEHISPEMMKLYLLLSGNPGNKSVEVCDSLDWKRAFGIHMWYLTSEGSPLQAAIEAYTKSFSNPSYAAKPTPSYDTEGNTTSYDILYHVLQLYKNRTYSLVKALNPDTHTSEKTDYQLSWLLLLFFQSVDVGLIDDCEETQLHTSFSAQLEDMGMWDLAILPLLYLKENSLKKNLVIGILNRNLSPADDDESKQIETKLIESFRVPSAWIHRVKTEKKDQFNDK